MLSKAHAILCRKRINHMDSTKPTGIIIRATHGFTVYGDHFTVRQFTAGFHPFDKTLL
jgi:hypothetical protein